MNFSFIILEESNIMNGFTKLLIIVHFRFIVEEQDT